MNVCIMVLLSLPVSLSYKNQVGTELLLRLAHVDHKKSGQVSSGDQGHGGLEGRRVLRTFAGTAATQGK